MDFSKNSGGLSLAILSIAGLLFILGCGSTGFFTSASQDGLSGPRVEFPHKVHLIEAELECGDCHELDEDTGAYTLSTYETCRICHSEEDDLERPEGKRIADFYKDDAPLGPFFGELSEEIIFDHKAHATSSDQCDTCHGDLRESESLGLEMAMSMDQCMDCHQDLGVDNSCQACHREISQTRRPSDHSSGFMKTHGLSSSDPDGRCELCHTENSCTACHLQTPPENHSNQFRRRGHGMIASMDRESCQTCHQTDFCRQCHEESRPISHRTSFGSPRNTHCLGCHIPVASEPSCSVCHRETPSHVATPKPPDHNAAMNCRQCHGIDASLPHPDDGSNCNFCHR